MKIIKDLVINNKLNPELVGLKCYIILNKSMDGLGLGSGYSVFKIQFLDYCHGNVRANTLSEITSEDEDFILCFSERNAHYHPLVICDNKPEAEMLAEQFNQFGYCSNESTLLELNNRISSLTRFLNFMYPVIKNHHEEFNKNRIDNDDRAHREFIEFAKDHYPKFLSNLNPNSWDEYHGLCVYLLGVNSDGTAIYHYPDMYGCWDVIVAIQLDDQRIVGINNKSTKLDCEWYPITESDFLSSFNIETLDDMIGTKLNYLTNGKYK